MFERFTEKAIKAIVLAQQECRRYSHNSVGSEHMLLGLISEGSGTAALVLKSKVNVRELRDKVETLVGRGMSPPQIEIPFTPRVKASLQRATEISDELNHPEVDTGHILFALLPSDNIDENAGSVAARALEDLGIDCAELRLQVLEMVKNPREEPTRTLNADELVFSPLENGSVFCPHCKESIRPGASVCRHCRRNPADTYKRCSSCAEWIIEVATTCRFCTNKQ
ncbi:MAG: hypothetical protein K2W95_05460 [Candidatus Obscuribacterales bacterium]|nr:hypothetical protein [Candidatus Obscuribacterales bacterium]